MRTIRTKVYKFNELSNEAKETAIEKHRETNTEYDWWEFVYEDFKQIGEYFGLDIDLKKTYFSGFSHQGQGSSFTAYIDIKKMLDCVKNETWKEYAPQENFSFYSVSKDMYRVSGLMSAYVEPTNRESSIKVVFNTDAGEAYPNIYAVSESLEELITDVCETLNTWFFRLLEKEYDYQTSDEAITETIEANEYEFTKDGELFHK